VLDTKRGEIVASPTGFQFLRDVLCIVHTQNYKNMLLPYIRIAITFSHMLEAVYDRWIHPVHISARLSDNQIQSTEYVVIFPNVVSHFNAFRTVPLTESGSVDVT
jgi:hypothetical protein